MHAQVKGGKILQCGKKERWGKDRKRILDEGTLFINTGKLESQMGALTKWGKKPMTASQIRQLVNFWLFHRPTNMCCFSWYKHVSFGA